MICETAGCVGPGNDVEEIGDDALVEVGVTRRATDDVVVMELVGMVNGSANRVASSSAQATAEKIRAANMTKRKVAVGPGSPETLNWRRDLVMVDEILLVGNHHTVMVDSYPMFILVK
ncbi:MAG TPA: hypothetical protein QF409_00010 [Acidimicrobiales bacterium]|nr:hypothetical protein [Acidimicrobiales bacterium]